MHAEAQSIGTGAAVSGGFAAFHDADKAWFAALLALLWLALLAGFVPDVLQHLAAQGRSYLPIVHVHAVLFVGWMVLLTTQVVLVRRQQVAVHRKLGQVGALWAPIMVAISLVTVFMVHRSRFGTPEWDPGFLAIQVGDLFEFSIFVAFALRLRSDAASHKRLMMLAAISLSNAGFGRFWGDFMIGHLGNGLLGNWAVDYFSDAVILAAFLLYDSLTRGRPHRVLVWGSALMAGTGVLASALYQMPAWSAFAGHWLRP
jgi:hypothetical protein